MQWLQINSRDNVAVVLDTGGVPAGLRFTTAKGQVVIVMEKVPYGHKIALHSFSPGDPIVKFGHVIGQAATAIAPGQHVHTHNVVMPIGLTSGTCESMVTHSAPHGPPPPGLSDVFQGYHRRHGRAGTRNYIVVAASVNCSATVVKAVARAFDTRLAELATHQIHGVIPLTHGAGCAQADDGLGTLLLNRALAGSIFHPNVVGALIIGLGCEKTTVESILKTKTSLGLARDIPLRQLTIQDVGGTAAAIRCGIADVEAIVADLPHFQRQPTPVSELALALNCGGSDVFSSLSANPLLGCCTDFLVGLGGTAVLAEIPECTGAEALLGARAATPAVQQRLGTIFQWWEEYAHRHQTTLNDNLSHGNIASGITTIIEKSMGAITKGGSTPLQQALEYAEPVTAHGLAIMNTPGFDPVSMTGLVAGGCNMAAFTTGRGSAYHCALVPTVKIASTTALFQRMPEDMDFNGGRILDGSALDSLAAELYDLMLSVAAGQQTCGERLGIGHEEFVPWAVGETL